MNAVGMTVLFLIGAAIFLAIGFCVGIDFERARLRRCKWKISGDPTPRASHYSVHRAKADPHADGSTPA